MLIRKLELILENCEILVIDGKYIGDFHVEDIRKEISRMACNHIGMMEICHEFCVEIHKDANKKYEPFGDKEWETLAFERLTSYNDITSIIIHMYDQYNEETRNDESHDKVEQYYLHWVGEDDCSNEAQHSKISKTGWLYLTVGETVDLEEAFPSEDVDDKEYADFHASMMNIGDKYWAEHEDILKNNSDTESNVCSPTANSEVKND